MWVDVGWPLTGRGAEIERIHTIVTGQEHGGIVLAGSPGVGKTTLLRIAAARARAAGRRVESMVGSRAGTRVPFGAAAHLLGAPTGRRPAEDAPVSLVPPRFGRAPDGRPTVLVVDDAHLLDDRSAALVHWLCAERGAIVAATVTGGAPAPDAIVALWKDGLAQRIDVPPLSEPVIDELVGRTLDGHVAGSVLATLRALAGGSPLYLRELILGGLESGALRQRAGTWQWSGSLRGARRLRELFVAQVDECGADTRDVLELVACGEPVPLAFLRDEPGLLRGLEAAERSGLVVGVEDGVPDAVRLAQPLLREVIRDNLGPARSRAIYGVLATALRRTRMRRDDQLRLTDWLLAAGADVRATTLLRAAHAAAVRFDLAGAERLARAAVERGAADARELLVDVLHWLGRHAECRVLLAGPAGTPAWAAARIRTLYGAGRRAEARVAVSAGPAGPEVDIAAAAMLFADGRCRPALDAARNLLLPASAPVAARLSAYAVAIGASAVLGRTGDALRLAADGGRLAEEHHADAPLVCPHVLLAANNAKLLAGRLREARAAADDGYRRAVASKVPGLIAAWATQRGVIAQVQGHLTTAAEALREVVAIEEEDDPAGNLRLHRTVLAGILAMAGDAPRAREALRRADESPAPPVPRLFRPQAAVNRAWVFAADGELDVAVAVASRGAAIARRADLPGLEALILHHVARMGDARRVSGRLAQLAERVGGDLVGVYARSAGALADADGGGLDAVAAAFDDLDAPLLAAEAAAGASRAHQAAGRRSSANSALERMRVLLRRCGPAKTTPLAGVGPMSALTAREREVAALAAGRASSPDIAQRLHLSVRTVNNHLGRVYAKLGISSRAELATLLAGTETESRPGRDGIQYANGAISS